MIASTDAYLQPPLVALSHFPRLSALDFHYLDICAPLVLPETRATGLLMAAVIALVRVLVCCRFPHT